MAKKLDDFAVEINLNGWYNKKDKKSYRAGQKFKGAEITERMVEAVESDESFFSKKTGKTHLVVELLGGGSASELRTAFDAYEPEKAKPEPVPKAKVEESEPKKNEEKKTEKKEKKPVRRARPSDD